MVDTTSSAPGAKSEAPVQPTKKSNKTCLILVLVGLVVIVLLCGGCAAIAFFSRSALGDRIREAVSENVSEDIFENVMEDSISDSTGEDVNVDLDSDEGTFTWESEDSSGSIGTGSEWPADMPSDVPEFMYGTIESAVSVNGTDGSGWSVSYTEAESDALAQYRGDLETAGWTISTTATVDGSTYLSAQKDARFVTCTHNVSEGTFQVIVGED